MPCQFDLTVHNTTTLPQAWHPLFTCISYVYATSISVPYRYWFSLDFVASVSPSLYAVTPHALAFHANKWRSREAFLLRSGMSAKYCDKYVCLSVCLSARITRKPHGRTSLHFLCMLPVAVARSSSDGVAMCYVLPVLWMT